MIKTKSQKEIDNIYDRFVNRFKDLGYKVWTREESRPKYHSTYVTDGLHIIGFYIDNWGRFWWHTQYKLQGSIVYQLAIDHEFIDKESVEKAFNYVIGIGERYKNWEEFKREEEKYGKLIKL